MKDQSYAEWARHFDNLQWTVTSILLAADAALLVYLADPAKFRIFLALFGIGLTYLAVLFASSMRELRQRFQQRIDDETRTLISVGRRWYQWTPFVLLFLVIQLGWTWLLCRHDPARIPVWALIGATAVAATGIVGFSTNRPPGLGGDA